MYKMFEFEQSVGLWNKIESNQRSSLPHLIVSIMVSNWIYGWIDVYWMLLFVIHFNLYIHVIHRMEIVSFDGYN